jgi:predicted PurR-regulated permease PerM
MTERTNLLERGTDEVAATAGQPEVSVPVPAPVTRPEQPPTGAPTATGPDPARVAVVLMASVLMVGVITYLGPILKPFLVAVFLYFSTKAAAGFLIRRRFPAVLAYLTLLVAGSLAVAVLTLLTYGEMMALRAEWPTYQERILALIGKAPGDASGPLAELFTTWSKTFFQEVFERGIGTLELLTLTFFYLLFILLGAGHLPQRVRRAFPNGGERIIAVAGQIGTGMERFMEVKTQVSLGMGLSAAVIMYLFGLQGWLLWGVLFFAFNYITYIGSMVACVPPVVLAFLDLDSPIAATALAVLVVLNRFVWIDYIEIKMAGRHLNINPILLFLWLAYWGWMWGVVGLILAFPMLTSLKIILEHLESTKGWAVLMSED